MATDKRSGEYLANLYREGVKCGRPPFYRTVEELIDKISQYFAQIECLEIETRKDNELDSEGNVLSSTTKEVANVRYDQGEPVPTTNGLALFLGYAGRQSLHDYLKATAIDPAYSYAIRGALAVIERYHEIRTATHDRPAGSIFILQNMGWATNAKAEDTGPQKPRQVFKIAGVEVEF